MDRVSNRRPAWHFVLVLVSIVGSFGCDSTVEGWATVFDENMTIFSSLEDCHEPVKEAEKVIRIDTIRVTQGMILGEHLYTVPTDCVRIRLTGRKAPAAGENGMTSFSTISRFERFDSSTSKWLEVPYQR